MSEKRALVKKIIDIPIYLYPDYEANKLYVTLYTLPTPRNNDAIYKIIETLNNSETKYPRTDLVLSYKIATAENTIGQEF